MSTPTQAPLFSSLPSPFWPYPSATLCRTPRLRRAVPLDYGQSHSSSAVHRGRRMRFLSSFLLLCEIFSLPLHVKTFFSLSHEPKIKAYAPIPPVFTSLCAGTSGVGTATTIQWTTRRCRDRRAYGLRQSLCGSRTRCADQSRWAVHPCGHPRRGGAHLVRGLFHAHPAGCRPEAPPADAAPFAETQRSDCAQHRCHPDAGARPVALRLF